MATPPVETELIVSGSHLMPNWRHQDCINDGALVIAGDTIKDIGTRREIKERHPATDELHEPHGLLMPGLVNTHTHAPMACFRGFADDLPLMTWLNEHIFPVEAKLDGDMVYHSTLLSIAEMIKSGTTSFCDMYLFSKEVARAAASSGMRSWVGEVLFDFPSPSYGLPENGLRYVREMFQDYREHPLVTVTVDPHSVYTCSPKLLEQSKHLAEEESSLYVIHLSETDAEVNGCLEQYGLTPVRHLENLGLLNERTIAVHCVQVDQDEIKLLARRGVPVSHCQESNMKLASGRAPIKELLDEGVNVTIGTDGSASNNDVDMFREMSTVAKAVKVLTMDPTAMNAETTLRAATHGGAAALGAAELIGTLETGKKADMIVLDLNQPHLVPMYNVPSHLVYAARGADVIHSIVNGQIIMRDRQLLMINEAEIIERMREISEKIIAIRTQNRSNPS